ncbi:hypothetical protein F4861DRAFT_536963 [Xylaria intraflava]|nr:hypothetical protein F4861DRAFT_536963 [Xylaria intraflava]
MDAKKKAERRGRRKHEDVSLAVRAMQMVAPVIAMLFTSTFALLSGLFSLFVMYLVIGSAVFGSVAQLGKTSPATDFIDYLVTLGPNAGPKFKFQDARPLAQTRVGNTTKFRLLVSEGTPSQTIKYLNINPEVNTLAYNALDTIDLPYLPAGDWTVATMGLLPCTGQAAVTGTTSDPLPGVSDVWDSDSYEYLDLYILEIDGCEGGKCKDNVKLVNHPSLKTPRNVAVMKYAIFPDDIPSIERETMIYKRLQGFPSAPKFLGHVTENGRVIGFLMEYIRSARPADIGGLFTDLALAKCRKALVDLHGLGVIHNDADPRNCFIRPDGAAVWIDYDMAEVAGADSDFQGDLTSFDSIRANLP